MSSNTETPDHAGKPTGLLKTLITRKSAEHTPWHQHQASVPNVNHKPANQRGLRVKHKFQ